jgi:hypothetical protein
MLECMMRHLQDNPSMMPGNKLRWQRNVQKCHKQSQTVVNVFAAAAVICLRTGAKVSVAHMYGLQHQPVPVVSLAPGWAIENAYIGRDKQYLTYDPKNHTWPCAAS